jgi:ABC-type multidrug transport system fused ATPase/permease subunit
MAMTGATKKITDARMGLKYSYCTDRDTLTIIVLSVYMVYLSPILASVIFLVAPVIAILVRFLSLLFRRYSERIQDSMADVTHAIKETLQNHRIIKIFNGQDFEQKKFSLINENNRKHNMKPLKHIIFYFYFSFLWSIFQLTTRKKLIGNGREKETAQIHAVR